MNSKQPPDHFAMYLDEKFKNVEEKLEKIADSDARQAEHIFKISETLANIASTLGEQKEQLAIHIRRTDILENDLRPIKTKVDFTVKGFGFVAIVVAFLSGLVGIFQWIS